MQQSKPSNRILLKTAIRAARRERAVLPEEFFMPGCAATADENAQFPLWRALSPLDRGDFQRRVGRKGGSDPDCATATPGKVPQPVRTIANRAAMLLKPHTAEWIAGCLPASEDE